MNSGVLLDWVVGGLDSDQQDEALLVGEPASAEWEAVTKKRKTQVERNKERKKEKTIEKAPEHSL